MTKLATIEVFNSLQLPEDSIDGLASYLQEIAEGFCPFLAPSMRRRMTTFTVVRSAVVDEQAAEELMFASAYALCESLRRKRAVRMQSHSALLCENVFFVLPNIRNAKGKEMLSWVHWVLKCRYTRMGILFGKFAKGDTENSKDGRKLPIPPCHFVSIRESVRAKDPQFFQKADWLLPALESANDIGQDAFEDMKAFESILKEVAVFSETPTPRQFETVLTAIAGSGFYPEAKAKATHELEARGCTSSTRGEPHAVRDASLTR